MTGRNEGVANDFHGRLDRLLRKQIPGCQALLACDRLSGGASQETYRLCTKTGHGETTFALRRAPPGAHSSNEEGPGLAVEALLMQVASKAGIPEPEVHYIMQVGDGLGEGFVMEWLKGETLGHRIVSAPALESIRPQLARQCGRILARIHAIDLDETGLRGKLRSFSPEAYVRFVWEQYQQLDSPQPMIDYTARWLLAHLPQSSETTLVHNDFRNGNLMIGPQGVNAVLDWETAHIGDPVRDLGWLCTRSWRFGRHDLPVGGFGEYGELLRGYQDGSGKTVDRDHLRFWEVFGSFWWAVGCLRLAYQFRSGEDASIERPAIGRRSSEAQIDCVNYLIPGAVTLAEDPGQNEGDDLPSRNELLRSVCDHLRHDVTEATEGRTRFLSRVAANSLEIVMRELGRGERAGRTEHRALKGLLNLDGDLPSLRWKLVRALRSGSQALEDEQLQAYLRHSVANQVAVDQPEYAGLKTALSRR